MGGEAQTDDERHMIASIVPPRRRTPPIRRERASSAITLIWVVRMGSMAVREHSQQRPLPA